MRFYIASRLENAPRVRELAAVLKAHGHEHTYDWTVHGSVQNAGLDVIERVAVLGTRGVERADVVIVMLPGGRGTHAELGIALGIMLRRSIDSAGKEHLITEIGRDARRLLVLSESEEIDFGTDGRTCAFYHHPFVERVGSWSELLAALGIVQ